MGNPIRDEKIREYVKGAIDPTLDLSSAAGHNKLLDWAFKQEWFEKFLAEQHGGISTVEIFKRSFADHIYDEFAESLLVFLENRGV